MSIQLQRMTRHATLAVAVAAIAASTALATDLRSPSTRDATHPAREAGAQLDLRSPDTRDAADAARARHAVTVSSPDARDWATGDLPPAATPTATVVVHRPSGFDWSDAAIGAAGGAGLILVLAGMWQVRRLARTEARPA